jgi:hypothetical protein
MSNGVKSDRLLEEKIMTRTVADQMVETLAAAGVERIYGIVGDSLNGFTDALRRHGGIQWLHVRTIVADAGDAAARRFLEFFAVSKTRGRRGPKREKASYHPFRIVGLACAACAGRKTS